MSDVHGENRPVDTCEDVQEGRPVDGPCYPNWPSTSGAFAVHRLTSIGDCSRCGRHIGRQLQDGSG